MGNNTENSNVFKGIVDYSMYDAFAQSLSKEDYLDNLKRQLCFDLMENLVDEITYCEDYVNQRISICLKIEDLNKTIDKP